MTIEQDHKLIIQIAERAVRACILPEHAIEYMLREAHAICPLRLEELLHANLEDFAYDIYGIYDRLDILDGSFRDGFSPRFAK